MTLVRTAVRPLAALVCVGALIWSAPGAAPVAAQDMMSGRCALGLATKTGTARPDVTSTGALRRVLLSARAIAFTGDEQSGAAFRLLLSALGIDRQVNPRLVDTGNGDPLELVVEGRADLGVSSPERVAATTGVQALTPLPTTPGPC